MTHCLVRRTARGDVTGCVDIGMLSEAARRTAEQGLAVQRDPLGLAKPYPVADALEVFQGGWRSPTGWPPSAASRRVSAYLIAVTGKPGLAWPCSSSV
ncbi:hypothetical protein GCM10022419_127860 [Nonomuraea rosea]|uniref:Uncharacterized protein n=1 Tax=Nonomuraea rosea TaxID=638574 RepID=A0ABP6ZVL3_9ACTN